MKIQIRSSLLKLVLQRFSYTAFIMVGLKFDGQVGILFEILLRCIDCPFQMIF